LLKALYNEKDILSYIGEIDKNKEYICPHCKEKVIFVDAIFKIKHFRHYSFSNCETEPETEKHLEMKQFLIDKLKLNPNQIEVDLGFAKPDLFLEEEKITIEMQHSPISFLEFIERTQNYSYNGFSVLWIFDIDLLNIKEIKIIKDEEGKLVSTHLQHPEGISESIAYYPEFIKSAHKLYYGRVYFYYKNQIIPIHFQSYGRIMADQYGISYFKYYKNSLLEVL